MIFSIYSYQILSYQGLVIAIADLEYTPVKMAINIDVTYITLSFTTTHSILAHPTPVFNQLHHL